MAVGSSHPLLILFSEAKQYVAILSSHSNQKTQDVYIHLSADGLKSEIIEVLDGFGSSRS